MNIQELGVSNYRNIRESNLKFSPQLNTFIGKNGQGKTNILEAIYLLGSGKSFRTSEKEALIGLNSIPRSQVTSRIFRRDLVHHVSAKITESEKTLMLNGKKTTGNKLSNLFPMVLFSPESLSVIKSSPNLRRKLIDDLGMAVFPQYPQVYGDYERLLKQKNALLRKMRDEEISNKENH